MEDTLQDDAWKDSFDKLLEPRPVLRDLNIIKKDVRASFNIDSSVENSGHGIFNQSASPPFLRTNLQAGISQHLVVKPLVDAISTPLSNRFTLNPFHCQLSPIDNWKLDYMPNDNVNRLSNKLSPATRNSKVKQGSKVRISKNQPLPKKRVCFEVQKDGLDSSEHGKDAKRSSKPKTINGKELNLQPGKWRRSLRTWRHTQHLVTDVGCSGSKVTPAVRQSLLENSVVFIGILPGTGTRKLEYIKKECTFRGSGRLSNLISECNWRKEVLRRCGQRMPASFTKMYAPRNMPNCRKIGEGVYGEVFLNPSIDAQKNDAVLKIIPIEGSVEVNGEQQKTFEQVLPEIVISKELCGLKDDINRANYTSGFVEIMKVSLVEGKYPNHLVKLWEKYDEEKESENDHPEIFTASQLYIVLELKFAGGDLSDFKFSNAEQSYWALVQIILTLAVGEEAFQFEHRDLHWGNILIISTNETHLNYKLNGKALTVPTKGVQITIIDYTLSRVTYDDVCLYNDLSKDEELFGATGDYQYDIYRMMRDVLNNDWTKYEPKTNVYWLSYIVSKLADSVHYRNPSSKTHKLYLQKLKSLRRTILSFKSAGECSKFILT